MVLRKSKFAALTLVLTALSLSPLHAAPSEYKITVDLVGADGSRRASGTFTCPTHDKCQNAIPIVFNGKPYKIGVRSYLLDDHHIRVTLQGRHVEWAAPFDDDDSDRPFEPQEWDRELKRWSNPPKLYGKAHIRLEM